MSVRADLGQNFSFPEPVELNKRLVDVLEPLEEIDERYFLSDGYMACFVSHSDRCKENGIGYRFEPIEREGTEFVKTVTTKEGQRTYSNFIVERGCDAM